MKVIVDTNVLVSGIFFSGPPLQILKAWRDGKLHLVISTEILTEYQRVTLLLGEKYPQIDLHALLDLITVNSTIVEAPPLLAPVSNDPDDDMFIACAIAGQVQIIVSGDKHLLDVDGFQDIRIVKPRVLVDCYLAE